MDLIVNKTPLSRRNHTQVGKKSPNTYFATIERDHGIDAGSLDAIFKHASLTRLFFGATTSRGSMKRD
jgi:hypothetical protein